MKRSSSTPPSSLQRQEYWAPPISIFGHVVGEHALQEGERARPLDLDLAHVRDVEHAGVRAHRRVLLADPLVGDRHLPAGKGNELGAELGVALVEGRASAALRRPRAAAYWRAVASSSPQMSAAAAQRDPPRRRRRRRRRRPPPARLQQRIRGLHAGRPSTHRAPRRTARRKRDHRPAGRRPTNGLRPLPPPPLPLGQGQPTPTWKSSTSSRRSDEKASAEPCWRHQSKPPATPAPTTSS